LFVPYKDVPDLWGLIERIVNGYGMAPWKTKHKLYAFPFENLDNRLSCRHSRHFDPPKKLYFEVSGG
jgi:hypothetical protein